MKVENDAFFHVPLIKIILKTISRYGAWVISESYFFFLSLAFKCLSIFDLEKCLNDVHVNPFEQIE